jgi:hypothetical protein
MAPVPSVSPAALAGERTPHIGVKDRNEGSLRLHEMASPIIAQRKLTNAFSLFYGIHNDSGEII